MAPGQRKLSAGAVGDDVIRKVLSLACDAKGWEHVRTNRGVEVMRGRPGFRKSLEQPVSLSQVELDERDEQIQATELFMARCDVPMEQREQLVSFIGRLQGHVRWDPSLIAARELATIAEGVRAVLAVWRFSGIDDRETTVVESERTFALSDDEVGISYVFAFGTADMTEVEGCTKYTTAVAAGRERCLVGPSGIIVEVARGNRLRCSVIMEMNLMGWVPGFISSGLVEGAVERAVASLRSHVHHVSDEFHQPERTVIEPIEMEAADDGVIHIDDLKYTADETEADDFARQTRAAQAVDDDVDEGRDPLTRQESSEWEASADAQDMDEEFEGEDRVGSATEGASASTGRMSMPLGGQAYLDDDTDASGAFTGSDAARTDEEDTEASGDEVKRPKKIAAKGTAKKSTKKAASKKLATTVGSTGKSSAGSAKSEKANKALKKTSSTKGVSKTETTKASAKASTKAAKKPGAAASTATAAKESRRATGAATSAKTIGSSGGKSATSAAKTGSKGGKTAASSKPPASAAPKKSALGAKAAAAPKSATKTSKAASAKSKTATSSKTPKKSSATGTKAPKGAGSKKSDAEIAGGGPGLSVQVEGDSFFDGLEIPDAPQSGRASVIARMRETRVKLRSHFESTDQLGEVKVPKNEASLPMVFEDSAPGDVVMTDEERDRQFLQIINEVKRTSENTELFRRSPSPMPRDHADGPDAAAMRDAAASGSASESDEDVLNKVSGNWKAYSNISDEEFEEGDAIAA